MKETELKPFEYFYGNPAYSWDGGIVTKKGLNYHDWKIDNEPWVEVHEN